MVGKLDKKINNALYQKEKEKKEEQENWEKGNNVFYGGLSKNILDQIRERKTFYQEQILKLFTNEINQIVLWDGSWSFYFGNWSWHGFIRETYDLMKRSQYDIKWDLKFSHHSKCELSKLLDQICLELDIEDHKKDLRLDWTNYDQLRLWKIIF